MKQVSNRSELKIAVHTPNNDLSHSVVIIASYYQQNSNKPNTSVLLCKLVVANRPSETSHVYTLKMRPCVD
jgi:hypothetical protein